jgi:hypothetical protein
MPPDLLADIFICLLLATLSWAWIFRRRQALQSQWTEMVAIGVVNGFLAFILYLFAYQLAPKLGIDASRWLMVPTVAATVLFFYDMLSRKR